MSEENTTPSSPTDPTQAPSLRETGYLVDGSRQQQLEIFIALMLKARDTPRGEIPANWAQIYGVYKGLRAQTELPEWRAIWAASKAARLRGDDTDPLIVFQEFDDFRQIITKTLRKENGYWSKVHARRLKNPKYREQLAAARQRRDEKRAQARTEKAVTRETH
jgi:hypothetical protein